MPFEMLRNDITLMQVDAIVNAANSSLLGGGGVDGAIHKAAGPKLLQKCRTLGGCGVGEVKLTRGYDLPAKYILHTVGPVWQGGICGEDALLRACYVNSLRLAARKRLHSIAFPLISSGAYGYPKDRALRIACDAIRDFLWEEQSDMQVYLVVFDPTSYRISRELHTSIAAYIDDHYAQTHENLRNRPLDGAPQRFAAPSAPPMEARACAPAPSYASLKDALRRMDDGFSPALLRLISEKGMTDPECYKRANIDRKLFSKIRSDKNYKPKKTTALAFCVALRLSLRETQDLLRTTGLTLSHSEKLDVIVEYFILEGEYDIYRINEALYEFDQPLLGGKNA